MKYSKKHGVLLLAVLFFAIIFCSTTSAANTTNVTTDINSSIASLSNTSNAVDSYSQTVNVSPNAIDPNTLYGTANFTLYKLPAYSGNASSYVLNVGVLPQVLLDLYAGKSSSWVNSTASPYASSADTPLEIKQIQIPVTIKVM